MSSGMRVAGRRKLPCHVPEADEIVADDLGEWDGRKTIRMKPVERTGGRLSLRVGARARGSCSPRRGMGQDDAGADKQMNGLPRVEGGGGKNSRPLFHWRD